MARENPTWGAPRIHGELIMLGFEVGEATVSRYMPRWRTLPSKSWRSFLRNHALDLVSIDFFVTPTVTFRIPYVFVVLAHERRRIVHFNATEGPSERWTGQQLVNAFPCKSGPKYLDRDRDKIYGAHCGGEGGCRLWPAAVEPAAMHVSARALSVGAPSRSARLTSRDGRGFEERQEIQFGDPNARRGAPQVDTTSWYRAIRRSP